MSPMEGVEQQVGLPVVVITPTIIIITSAANNNTDDIIISINISRNSRNIYIIKSTNIKRYINISFCCNKKSINSNASCFIS